MGEEPLGKEEGLWCQEWADSGRRGKHGVWALGSHRRCLISAQSVVHRPAAEPESLSGSRRAPELLSRHL